MNYLSDIYELSSDRLLLIEIYQKPPEQLIRGKHNYPRQGPVQPEAEVNIFYCNPLYKI